MRLFLSAELNVDISDKLNAACQSLASSVCESIFMTSDAECSIGAVLACWLNVADDECVVSSRSIIHSFDSGLLLPRSNSFLCGHTNSCIACRTC